VGESKPLGKSCCAGDKEVIRFALVISYFVLSFVILSISYPIWHRWEDMSRLRSYLLAVYLLMSVIVTVIGVLLTPVLVSGLKRASLWRRPSFRSLLDFALLSLLAVYLGPFRGPLPYISDFVRGPFFSEWYFLTFIFFASPLLSLLSALYYRLTEKRPLEPQ
jgi:hypothetical protein